MFSEENAIVVQDVDKRYQIYRHPQDRLKQSLVPRFQRALGLRERSYFRDFVALQKVSFTVRKGETLGIVGSNGSGKSTLLQIICGTLFPSAGQVTTRGQIAALLELGTGFNTEFSGLENVFLYGQVLGLSRERIERLLPAILEFANIGEFVHQPVKTYSSGMVVRLAFAVSVIREPDILVVDEALAVGDEAFQRKCFARIEELKQHGTTILFVSHSANLVVSLCDRALLLDEGELLFDGRPKDAIALYHKFAFAPTNKRESIRREIRQSKSSGDQEEETPEGVPKEKGHEVQRPYFVSHFVSKSRMEYEVQGAMIEQPRLTTLTGEDVNHLVHGDEYIYTYSVRFLNASSNVRFGMLVKTLTGVELGGGAYPSVERGAEYISEGRSFQPRFRFRCLLNPGTYLLNAGVMGLQGDSDTYLHRILDAIIFRVLPLEERVATGTINLDLEASIHPALMETDER